MLRVIRLLRMRLTWGRLLRFGVKAIGEVLLIVIGILIANDLNEARARQERETLNRELLEETVREAKLNKDYMNYVLFDTIGHVGVTQALENARRAMNHLSLGMTRESIAWLLNESWIVSFTFQPNRSAYEQLVGTGRLYSLANQKITNLIQVHYQYLKAEEHYMMERHKMALDRWMDCKTGYIDLLIDSYENAPNALANHAWINNRHSPEYLDLKAAVFAAEQVLEADHSALQRLLNANDEFMSTVLQELNGTDTL